jgi:putative ABC transport system permease protein
MLRIALKMLMGDRVKYAGLLLGITFTSFLVTFAASYFCGFMTRGFALVSENAADVWVMDPAISSAEQTANMVNAALARVRSVEGVASAMPLALGTADVVFPNGRVQPFQIIGVDDVTLTGVPQIQGGVPSTILRVPDTVIVDPGGTDGKLETPALAADQWPYNGPHLDVPTRELAQGDELLVNDNRVRVAGIGKALPRFPPRPLMYTTYSNADRILLPERRRLTFVLANAAPDVSPQQLAQRIQKRTGLRARTRADFKTDTVHWYLTNSEDVGDMAAMLYLAMTVGFGMTGVMLYMFTYESLKQYAVLKAMGATPKLLITMILAQAGLCALIGTGLGLGLCAILGELAAQGAGYPFRMMWFTPLFGGFMVIVVSLVAAMVSTRPVLKLDPAAVFAGR